MVETNDQDEHYQLHEVQNHAEGEGETQGICGGVVVDKGQESTVQSVGEVGKRQVQTESERQVTVFEPFTDNVRLRNGDGVSADSTPEINVLRRSYSYPSKNLPATMTVKFLRNPPRQTTL